jgi:hypothetical protein
MSRMPTTTSIEYFLWKHSDAAPDRLVYYDNAGNYYEKEVAPEIIEKALKVFDGRRRSAPRQTGGQIMVEPYQLVLVSEGDREAPPQVRIRVKFTDLKYDPLMGARSPQYLTYSETLSPEELADPFPLSYYGPQTFVMNFGQGLVPIYVFHHETDENENTTVYFIELKDLDTALNCPAGEKVPVQVYQVNRDALRYASDISRGGQPSEYELARENYRRLLAAGASPIPEGFKVGTPILVPAGGTMQDIRHYLRIMQQRKNGKPGASDPIYISIQREESGELMPFGILEE